MNRPKQIKNLFWINKETLLPYYNNSLQNDLVFYGRILNNIPVLYGDNSKKKLSQLQDLLFDSSKTYKWGHYHERSLYGDSQGELGKTTVYIDTRIQDWYVMWESTKVKFDELPGLQKEVVLFAWTPKVNHDSVLKAGYRLFWARVLVEHMISSGEFYSNKNLDLEDPWNKWFHSENDASISCFHVFSSVSRTDYKNSNEFNKYFSKAPEFLKPHIQSRKKILVK